ncbi:DUF2529 family protein [Neobacillus sp. SM06]|uniref:DUF2529 family protein n=1 Tax=Neobacillus sp. SM06 TaxID=3422492 RepID=UPI003D267AA7
MLAQAPAGDGAVYFYGAKEMKAVLPEATEGAEPLQFAKTLTEPRAVELTEADRIVIFSRYSTDSEAVALAAHLNEKGIPFVAVSSVSETAGSADLTELADVHINLWLTKGLLPDEQGGRFGQPFAMAALFVYYGLSFTMNEILAEYEL